MGKYDFSLEGMANMQLLPSSPSEIHDLLMYETLKVKSSLLDNLKKNPEKGTKLIRHFGFLVKRHVFITEKQVFLERWNYGRTAEAFAIGCGRIDRSIVDELNNYISEICYKAEDELFEAYQDQKIDPVNRQVKIVRPVEEFHKNSIPFSFYLKNIEKKNELIILLKKRYPNGKNKQCAIMIAALRENNILDIPDKPIELYRAIADEWNIKDFDRRGLEQILKKWWIQITEEWLQKHTVTYPSEVSADIEYLKTKINEIESN